jgi:hypothetical protein
MGVCPEAISMYKLRIASTFILLRSVRDIGGKKQFPLE